MGKIDWKSVWDLCLKNKELFPYISKEKDTILLSCPTRFSNSGELAIEITPSFNDDSIVFEMLVFNENLSLDDLKSQTNSDNDNDKYNQMTNQLVVYELSNRVMERFKIMSSGFDTEDDAVNAVVDYLNSKATESGRMFDDKLDELNDMISNKDKSESLLKSIRDSRSFILKKVSGIVESHYGWKHTTNESFDDSVMPLYDSNGVMKAVVSISDGHLLIDLSSDMTAKIDLVQSDEDIENEIVNDISNAEMVVADKEIDQLKEIVSDNHSNMTDDYSVSEIPSKFSEDEEFDYMGKLERRVAKLESLLIRKILDDMK